MRTADTTTRQPHRLCRAPSNLLPAVTRVYFQLFPVASYPLICVSRNYQQMHQFHFHRDSPTSIAKLSSFRNYYCIHIHRICSLNSRVKQYVRALEMVLKLVRKSTRQTQMFSTSIFSSIQRWKPNELVQSTHHQVEKNALDDSGQKWKLEPIEEIDKDSIIICMGIEFFFAR